MGWYHAALNYPQQEWYQSYRHAADKVVAVDPAIAAGADAEPLEYRKPCHKPKGQDESDLCAQWKAARAAELGALWTERGFWLSAISAIGIGAALLLTIDSNKIARSVGEAQTRAYLSIIDPKVRILSNGVPWVDIVVVNSGQSPAIRFSWSPTVRYDIIYGLNQEFDFRQERKTSPFETWTRDIPVGGQIPLNTSRDGPKDEFHTVMEFTKSIGIALTIDAEWLDVFGKKFTGKWDFHGLYVGKDDGRIRFDEKFPLSPTF